MRAPVLQRASRRQLASHHSLTPARPTSSSLPVDHAQTHVVTHEGEKSEWGGGKSPLLRIDP